MIANKRMLYPLSKDNMTSNFIFKIASDSVCDLFSNGSSFLHFKLPLTLYYGIILLEGFNCIFFSLHCFLSKSTFIHWTFLLGFKQEIVLNFRIIRCQRFWHLFSQIIYYMQLSSLFFHDLCICQSSQNLTSFAIIFLKFKKLLDKVMCVHLHIWHLLIQSWKMKINQWMNCYRHLLLKFLTAATFDSIY